MKTISFKELKRFLSGEIRNLFPSMMYYNSHINKEFGVNQTLNYYLDEGALYTEREVFFDPKPEAIYSQSLDLAGKFSTLTVIDICEKIVSKYLKQFATYGEKTNYSIDMKLHNIVYFKAYRENKPLGLVYMYFETNNVYDITDDSDLGVQVRIFGNYHFCRDITDELNDKIGKATFPKMYWHYLSDGQHNKKIFPIEATNPISNDFYPYVKTYDDDGNVNGGMKEKLEEYLHSNEPILILLGPPGTGKTSALRDMIVSNKLTVSFTYEEELLSKDKFFMEFLFNKDEDMIIIEDADNFLGKRDPGNDKLNIISKLLNVSDGLIKIVSKKIVFTTNLPDVSDLDDALLRPGRCYDVINFEKLKYNEVETLCENHGLQIPKEEKEYSLAEVLTSNKNRNKVKDRKNKVGFV